MVGKFALPVKAATIAWALLSKSLSDNLEKPVLSLFIKDAIRHPSAEVPENPTKTSFSYESRNAIHMNHGTIHMNHGTIGFPCHMNPVAIHVNFFAIHTDHFGMRMNQFPIH